jgi:hypothetical protein
MFATPDRLTVDRRETHTGVTNMNDPEGSYRRFKAWARMLPLQRNPEHQDLPDPTKDATKDASTPPRRKRKRKDD